MSKELDKEIEKVLREGALSWNISYSDMCFIAEHFYELGKKDTKEQMMKDIPKWHKVQRGSCFDKHTNFLLSAREGHFYCSSIEVPRDGYILLVDELERLPKEDEK